MTIRPVAPADLASLAELVATTIRQPFAPRHDPEKLVDYSAIGRPWLHRRRLRLMVNRLIDNYYGSGSDRQQDYWPRQPLPAGEMKSNVR